MTGKKTKSSELCINVQTECWESFLHPTQKSLENSLNLSFLCRGKLEGTSSESDNWALNAWSINKDTTKINYLHFEAQKYKVEQSFLSHLISCARTEELLKLWEALKQDWILSVDRFIEQFEKFPLSSFSDSPRSKLKLPVWSKSCLLCHLVVFLAHCYANIFTSIITFTC